jgi:hypothetical protein
MRRIVNTAVELALGFCLAFGLCGSSLQAQNQTSAPSEGSGTSLGNYARQVRKDSGTSAKPKVFDNDNLPKDDKLSIVGSETPADPSAEDKGAESDNGASSTKPAGENKASPEGKPSSAANAEGKASPEGKPSSAANAAGETPAAAKTTAESKPAGDKAADPNKPSPEQQKQEEWKQWGDKIASQQQQISLLGRELDVLQREYKLRAAEMYADAGNRLRNSADWDKQDAQYKQQIADKQQALDDAKQTLDDLQEQARKAGVPSSIREP